MKNKVFYLQILISIIIIFSSVTFSDLSKQNINLTFYDEDNRFVLVEKNIISKSFISYLYKDDSNNYISSIYDYNTNEPLNLEDVIKQEKIDEYNEKIKELLYLKYPKFIVKGLINENTKKSYLFRDNELVIYFNDYVITPEVNEILYLKVNYQEIKEYINFTVILDKDYENESGFNYTNSKKAVAITFDDSPNKENTTKILKSLNDNLAHATFFIVGEKAINNEDILLSIKSYGNEIGSHTYSHQNFNKLTNKELIDDYQKMNHIYKKLFYEDLKLLRPPYGIYKNNQLNTLNVSFILWSLDTCDWKYRNSNYLVNYVINNIKDGDILLFHDTYSSTVNAIEELLPILYSKGYLVMSVSELAELKGYKLENNTVYHNFS